MMDNDEILEAAHERFEQALWADDENRENALDDLEFLSGDQWPDDVKESRNTAKRPMLTVNRMPQFLRQVTGDIRQTNPAINVLPADSDASENIAEIYDGLIRQIEVCSGAQNIYESTAECAAACSMGYFRIRTDYVDDESFDQEILIERIANPFSVLFDPAAKDPTRKDANFCFVLERMTKKKFRKQFPGKSEVDYDYSDMPESQKRWYDGGDIIVAEYYWVEEDHKTIYLLEDGTVAEDKPASGGYKTRRTRNRQVYWTKLSGKDVLEKPRKIPGRYIPVIAVIGEELHIGERIVRSSVIRYAKDAQRMYNYWRSAQTELVALQPKAPFLVTKNQIAGVEKYWKNMNNSNLGFLPYVPDERAPGAPQRQQPPVFSAGMSQEISLAAEDMKATTGIYDAGLGNRSNESSGIAIQRRQLESDISTSIYVDNLARAIEQCGKIIASWIPIIYDTSRIIRILGKDMTPKMVGINQPMMTPAGPVYVNPLNWGKYDVRITTGPSYTSQRQQSSEMMLEFVTKVPAAAQAVMDLIARNMDWPGADEFADRLKKILPPGLAEPDKEQNPEALAQQAVAEEQQKMNSAVQALEMSKAVAEAKEAEAKASEAQLDVMNKQLELAQKDGTLTALIQSMVAQALQNQLSNQQTGGIINA